MKPSIDWLAVLNLLGIGQGFFLTVVFLTSRTGSRAANRLLGWLLLTLSLPVLEIVLCYTDAIYYVPFLVNMAEPFDLMHGPLLYLFALAITQPHFRFQNKHFIHFSWAFIYAVYMIPYYLQSNAFKLYAVAGDYHKAYGQPAPLEHIAWFPEYFRGREFVDVLDKVVNLIYLLLTLLIIYQSIRGNQQSGTGQSRIKLLRTVTIYFFVIFLVSGVLSFTSEGDLGDIYISSGISLIFYGISFHIITHSQLLSFPSTEPSRRKYAKSALSPESTSVFKQRLLACLETQQPYLDPELTMPLLAEKVNLSTHHLSQLINEQMAQSFADLMSYYRIEEAKRKLVDARHQHEKIEAVAYQCGFNSKSAFNTAFKKWVGVTPSNYRRNQLTDA